MLSNSCGGFPFSAIAVVAKHLNGVTPPTGRHPIKLLISDILSDISAKDVIRRTRSAERYILQMSEQVSEQQPTRAASHAESELSRPAIRGPLASMWALFLGVLAMMLGNGLQGTALGVRATTEAFAVTVIGLIQAAYYVGFLIGSRFTVRALRKVGHIRVFAALASLASTSFVLPALFVNPVLWLVMRMITGFCLAGLYVVIESWLNDQTEPENRGRTLSIYMVVTMSGVTGGQLLLNVADPSGFELFVIASALMSVALVPMALSESSAPRLPPKSTLRFSELLKVVPTGIITMFFSGMGAGAIFAIGPVYAAQIGMSTRQISFFMAAALVGSVVLQMPIGSLSDRLPRRGVMLGTAILATGASVFGVGTGLGSDALIAMFLIGGSSFPLYSLAIAYTNDWITDEQRVGASAFLVMVNGIGAIVGPLVASLLISGIGASGFFWTLAATHVLLAGYLVFRIVARDPVPVEDQSPYRPYPARSSALATSIGRRVPKPKRSALPNRKRRSTD